MKKAFWCILLLVLWELGVRVSHVSPLLVPGPGNVLRALVRDLTQGHLLRQTADSVLLIVTGLLVSLILAICFSLLAKLHPVFAGFMETLTTIAHPLPGLALMPLIILWFGTGTGAVFAIIIHSALWPLLLNLMTGLDRTPVIYTDVGKNLSMSETRILLEIRLRYAMPDLITGCKTGWSRAWRAFISAEMVFGAVGAYGGLGSYLLGRRTFMDTAGLFAGIVVVIIIGILVEEAGFRLVEKHTVERWGMER